MTDLCGLIDITSSSLIGPSATGLVLHQQETSILFRIVFCRLFWCHLETLGVSLVQQRPGQ